MDDLNSFSNYNLNHNQNQYGINHTNNRININQNSAGYINDSVDYNQNQTGYTDNGYGYSHNPIGYADNGMAYNQDRAGYTNNGFNYSQNPVGYPNNGISYNLNSGSNPNNQMRYSQGAFGYLNNQTNNLSSHNRSKKIKVSFNSPAVLSFAIICLIVLIIQYMTNDAATYAVFSVYYSSLFDPLTYVRFFGHVLGHADLDHYMSNMMYLLIVGPLLEEKYGSKSIVLVMAVTAFVTGVVNFVFCPDVATLGASGIVFAFILLSSLTCMKQGEIPLTFIVVAILYFGEQFLEAALLESNISNVSHIVGGVCGCVLGYLLNKNKIAAFNDNNNNSTYY